MEVAHPTAGWEQVGERFYRKTQLYTQVFDLDLDLDNYIVAGAPYGGAVGRLLALSLLVYRVLTTSQRCIEMRRSWWPSSRPRPRSRASTSTAVQGSPSGVFP